MAGADRVVCPFFGVVFERLKSFIYKEQLNKLGPLVKKRAKKLYTTFCEIKPFINDAERRQFNKEEEDVDGIHFWLQGLHDAAYEADDVFDELEYEALQQAEGASGSNKKRKRQRKQREIFEYEALQQVEGASGSNKKRKRQRKRKKIENLIRIFDELAKKCLQLDLQKVKEKSVLVSPDRITDPRLTEPKVYGRDEAREVLVKQLLGSAYLTSQKFRTPISYKHPTANQRRVLNSTSSSSNGRDNISVFPIQGMGGLGKTTLAKIVYNDERVKNHFDFRSWVCISTDFDTRRIMKEIVASLPRQTSDAKKLSDAKELTEKFELQEHFHKESQDKRFLIVLDDVWNVTQDEWNEMKAFFRAGAQGSSIIVTTRLLPASYTTGTVPPNCISKLSDKNCLKLFKQYAFGPGNEEMPSLVKIGEEILKKCQGLPLVVKALGCLLRFKNDENEWLSVKDNAIWDSENHVLPVLRLSYYNLPSMLKRCFVFCSIFPKSYMIQKEQLIRLWMANGLLEQFEANIELEDVGNEIFSALLWRSFFQDTEKDVDGNIVWCKMHDIVHDLAKSIAGDEYFVEDARGVENITKRTRYVSLLSKSEVPSSSILESMKTSSPPLRSFIRLHDWMATLKSELVFKFILLQALDLHNCEIKVVPDCIGDMKHLRYLNLSYNPFKSLPESFRLLINMQTLNLSWCDKLSSLPESFCLLRNMQTLNLSWCSKLSSWPEHIENMRCLVHLHIEACPLSISMPVGIGQLTRLRTLSRFTVGKESGSRVVGLQELNNLRGELCIHGLEGVKTLTEAKEANLVSKKNLHYLELRWALGSDSYSRQQRHQDVIEGLQPHSNLRKLFVEWYGGVTLSPSWLTEVPNLVEVSLSYCTCEHLGSLRKLPRLKIVKLSNMYSLKFIVEEEVVDDTGDASASGFLSLEELSLDWMPNLEGFSSSSSSSSWSSPAAAASAEEEEVFRWVEGLNLEGSASSSSSQAVASSPTPAALFPCNKRPKLERCPPLKRGGVPLSSLSQAPITQQVALFPRLKKVNLYRCPKLKALPVELLNSLATLTELEISNCPNLVSLAEEREGGLKNLSSLETLRIINCQALKRLPELEKASLVTLTELKISFCPNLVSLAEEREGGLKNLSSLKTLDIMDCDALKRLPELEKASLVTLTISYCFEMEFSEEDFEHLVVLEQLRLRGLPKLRCFPEGIKHSASTLRHLEFRPCTEHGVDLPDWIGTTLTSLEYLEIVAPKNWKVLPQWMQHLTALKTLEIHVCDEELVEQWKTSDMVSHIPAVKVHLLDDEDLLSSDL